MSKMLSRPAPPEYPPPVTRLGQAPGCADDREEEDRSEMSGLRMSLLSVALAALLAAVLLTWHLLPVYYLWNYLAGVTIWLLAMSIPVVALAALVSSVLDLMRVGGTDGEVAGKGSAVAGLILSILVLILCVVFLFSFREPDSSQNEGASRPKEHSAAKLVLSPSPKLRITPVEGTQSTQRKKTEAREFTEQHSRNQNSKKRWNTNHTNKIRMARIHGSVVVIPAKAGIHCKHVTSVSFPLKMTTKIRQIKHE